MTNDAAPSNEAWRKVRPSVESACRPKTVDTGSERVVLGVGTRDIRTHIEEIYGIGISPEPLSAITDAVIEQVQPRSLRPGSNSL